MVPTTSPTNHRHNICTWWGAICIKQQPQEKDSSSSVVRLPRSYNKDHLPSYKDGISPEEENMLRSRTCRFIEEAANKELLEDLLEILLLKFVLCNLKTSTPTFYPMVGNVQRICTFYFLFYCSAGG